MARDLNSALRARRDRIIRDGSKTYAVLWPDGSKEPVRDWDTALYVAAQHLAVFGPGFEAQEFAWDPEANDAYLVSRRRVFA